VLLKVHLHSKNRRLSLNNGIEHIPTRSHSDCARNIIEMRLHFVRCIVQHINETFIIQRLSRLAASLATDCGLKQRLAAYGAAPGTTSISVVRSMASFYSYDYDKVYVPVHVLVQQVWHDSWKLHNTADVSSRVDQWLC